MHEVPSTASIFSVRAFAVGMPEAAEIPAPTKTTHLFRSPVMRESKRTSDFVITRPRCPLRGRGVVAKFAGAGRSNWMISRQWFGNLEPKFHTFLPLHGDHRGSQRWRA